MLPVYEALAVLELQRLGVAAQAHRLASEQPFGPDDGAVGGLSGRLAARAVAVVANARVEDVAGVDAELHRIARACGLAAGETQVASQGFGGGAQGPLLHQLVHHRHGLACQGWTNAQAAAEFHDGETTAVAAGAGGAVCVASPRCVRMNEL